MGSTILLITPPFTQLNTPYPATAYLKGFLKTKNIDSYQADLGIETILALFSREGLEEMFARAKENEAHFSANSKRIFAFRDAYLITIDDTIAFLQGKNPTLAHRICNRSYLPEASRFTNTTDLEWAFGSLGVQDNAKHLATMYLEDLADFISENIDEHFGFSRYAERLGRSANSFDELYVHLQSNLTYVEELMLKLLAQHVENLQPDIVGLSVPFPGNLVASLRCGQWLKKNHPAIKIIMGGGFANTELRSLSDKRVMEFYDFISLDDGEAPIEQLIHHIRLGTPVQDLKRSFTVVEHELTYVNNIHAKDYRQGEVGTPDYGDLPLDKYISAIEVVNPMHRLWSDGRWNKLTMAHGCYWGKCTFCDISLDYIRLYEPVTAALLCDRMQTIIEQTGHNGFHFVDEAAPPALMRALAIEILRRKLVVSWWANIRFEKSFTRDLCLLLKASGCIAVSGGLEVASDRLLALIEKGITVAQVARVNKHFTEAGIMVHAYLMYGFPTQTAQETIDSLEMVRQMFQAGILQSAYWHLFTMTAHSPVGLNPAKYKVQKETELVGSFANNDILHADPTGADHESFGFGLKKSLFNYMNKLGLDEPLHKWFDFKTPRPSVPADFILKVLNEETLPGHKPDSRIIWLGTLDSCEYFTQSKKGMQRQMATLSFYTLNGTEQVQLQKEQADWLMQMLPQMTVHRPMPITLREVEESYDNAGLEYFELFWDNKPMSGMHRMGLLRL